MLVTGAYDPEISAAAVQCRSVAAALRGIVDFNVLTTSVTPGLPARDVVDDVPVFRAHVDPASAASKGAAAVRIVRQFMTAAKGVDLVHIHGVSLKNVPVTALARLRGMPIAVHLHTAGQDEPAVVRRRGAASWWAFHQAARVMSVSPLLSDRYTAGAGTPTRVDAAPNGVDLERFKPVSPADRRRIRHDLALPDGRIVLFVGFFSRDKRPDFLFRAWRRVAERATDASLVFVGATDSTYYEIDSSLESAIRDEAARSAVGGRVVFVRPTTAIERYYAAADVFALPSIREAMPLALLEAMATGLPSIASRLAGATDAIVRHGVDGVLVAPDDEDAWAAELARILTDPETAARLGAHARSGAVERFGIERSAQTWLRVYEDMLGTHAVNAG